MDGGHAAPDDPMESLRMAATRMGLHPRALYERALARGIPPLPVGRPAKGKTHGLPRSVWDQCQTTKRSDRRTRPEAYPPRIACVPKGRMILAHAARHFGYTPTNLRALCKRSGVKVTRWRSKYLGRNRRCLVVTADVHAAVIADIGRETVTHAALRLGVTRADLCAWMVADGLSEQITHHGRVRPWVNPVLRWNPEILTAVVNAHRPQRVEGA